MSCSREAAVVASADKQEWFATIFVVLCMVAAKFWQVQVQLYVHHQLLTLCQVAKMSTMAKCRQC